MAGVEIITGPERRWRWNIDSAASRTASMAPAPASPRISPRHRDEPSVTPVRPAGALHFSSWKELAHESCPDWDRSGGLLFRVG
jgi:hypothetical protein